MNKCLSLFLAVTLLAFLGPLASFAAVSPYSQDFEGLNQEDPDALANDGWLVFGNVFTPGGEYLYGYGPFGAPNGGAAFSAIVIGEGGAEQGEQQLSVYSDYNNADHGNGNLIEANVFQEQTIDQENVGQDWCFDFQAKLGNLESETTALAFIKTLDPSNNYQMTNFITLDMTNTPTTWQGYSLSLSIDESLVGQILQIGFASTATNYEGSGVFYDNIVWDVCDPTATITTTIGTLKSSYR